MAVMILRIILTLLLMAGSMGLSHAAETYGERICTLPGYSCLLVNKADTWETLFPDANQRELIRYLNRMNTRLKSGRTIAVPDKLETISLMDIAPFPGNIAPDAVNRIVVNQAVLAWGAFDAEGRLVRWGPISCGKSYCPDIKYACLTRPGVFRIYHKRGRDCKSKKFPIGKGGARMPYCMFYDRGYAMHGSYTVPGRNDSHGCVRLFINDAQWLNEEFVRLNETLVYIDTPVPSPSGTHEKNQRNDKQAPISWH